MSQIETKKKKDTRYSKWTIKELLQECESSGLDSSDCETKAEIIDLLMKTQTNNNPNAVAKKTSAPSLSPSQATSENNISDSTEQIPQRKNSSKASTLPSNFNAAHIQPLNQNLPPSSTIVLPRFTISTTIPVKSATEKTFTAYVVDVIEKDETRTVLKRYRQFEDLHDSLKKNFPKDMVPKLTAKKLIGNLNPEFVNKRCHKLEAWLNLVAGLPGIFNTEYMKTFLEQVEVPGKDAFTGRSKSKSFLNAAPPPSSSTASSSSTGTNGRSGTMLNKVGSGNFPNEDENTQKMIADKVKTLQAQLDACNANKLTLDLSSLGLTGIPNILFEQKTVANNLMTLDLSDNFITGIPVDIGFAFCNLQGLSFRNNGITKLNKYIKNVTTLVTLDLSKNNIKDNVIEGINGLQNLIQLNLSSNGISVMPPVLNLCQALQILDISYNNLTTIPESFGETLLTLVELNISHNEIQELPTSIGKLSKLKKLDLSHNKLQDLPVSLLDCTSLRVGIVIVEGNPINEQLLVKARAGAPQLFSYLEHCLEGWKGKSNQSKLDFSRLSIAEPPPLERNWNQVFQPKSTPEGSSSSLGEQVIMIQQWAINEIQESFIPKLSIMKQKIETASSLEEAKSYAQLVRELKRMINEAGEHNFWIRVNKALSKLSETEKPPEEVPITKGGDPLVTLKSVTTHVVSQVIVVLKCVLQVLHASTMPQEIIRIVRVVQQMNKIFQDASPAL